MLFLLAIFFLAPLTGLDVFGWMVGRPVAFFEKPLADLLHRLIT
jgi:hypothetical protein